MEIKFRCARCNIELDVDMVRGVIYVDPCDKCIDKERDESYSQGYDEARKETEK